MRKPMSDLLITNVDVLTNEGVLKNHAIEIENGYIAAILKDSDIEKAKENIKNLNPNATILCVSAKSGEGMDEFVDWLKEAINN